jgi:hypothetical protein
LESRPLRADAADAIVQSSLGDGLDRGDGELLTVPDFATIAFAALHLEIDHLLAALLPVNGKRNLGPLDIGSTDLEVGAVRNGANGVELDIRTCFDRELFNLDPVTDANKSLLAAGFKNCICLHFYYLILLFSPLSLCKELSSHEKLERRVYQNLPFPVNPAKKDTTPPAQR